MTEYASFSSYGTTMSTSGESIAALASESAISFPGSPMWLWIQQIVISLSKFRMSLISSRISMRRLGLLVDFSDWMAWMDPRESLKTTDR